MALIIQPEEELKTKPIKKANLIIPTEEQLGYPEIDYKPSPGTSRGLVSDISPSDFRFQLKTADDIAAFNKELRAQRQSIADQWGNAFIKFGGNVLTTAAELPAMIVAGVPQAIAEGNITKIPDNIISQSMDDFREYLEKTFPNYYTQAQQNASLLENFTYANFWADKFLKNAGFTVGAFIGGAGFGALTKGLIKLMIKQAVTKGIPLTTDALADINTIQKSVNLANKTLKYENSIQRYNGVIAMAASEASIEARQNKNQFIDNAIADFQKKNGREPNNIELQTINDEADAVVNAGFLFNMAVLLPTDMFAFGKLLGSVGINEFKNIRQIIKTATGYIGKQPLLSATKFNLLGRPILEGPVQEQLQYAIQQGTTDYYLKKFNNKGIATLDDALSSLGKGMTEAYGTKQGWEQGIIGAMTGLLFSGGAFVKESKIDQQRNLNTEALLTRLNGTTLDKVFKPLAEHFVRFQVSENNKQRASETNDIFAFKNEEADQFFSYIQSRIDAGRFEDIIDDLKALNLSDEEFRKIANIPEGQPLPKSQKEFTDGLINKANQVNKLSDQIDERFPFVLEDIKQILKHSAYTIEDVTRREKLINDEIIKLSEGQINLISERKIDPEKYRENLNKKLKELKLNPLSIQLINERLPDLDKLDQRRQSFSQFFNQLSKTTTQKEFIELIKTESERVEKLKPKTKAIIEGKETEGELWADNKGQSYLKVKKSPTEFSSYPIEQKDGIWTQKITEPIETETIRPELTIESIANKITKAEPLTPEEEEFRRNNSEAIETELQKAALKQPPPTDIKAKIADIEKRRQEELREHYEPTEKEKAEGALGYVDERLVSIRNEIKKQRLVMPSEIKKASNMTRKLLELGWSPQRIVERLNKDFGFNIEYKETETDRINAKYDAEYLTEVKDGRMTREQAMQALEEAGRKESKTYAELAALPKEKVVPIDIEAKKADIERRRQEELNKIYPNLEADNSLQDLLKVLENYNIDKEFEFVTQIFKDNNVRVSFDGKHAGGLPKVASMDTGIIDGKLSNILTINKGKFDALSRKEKLEVLAHEFVHGLIKLKLNEKGDLKGTSFYKGLTDIFKEVKDFYYSGERQTNKTNFEFLKNNFNQKELNDLGGKIRYIESSIEEFATLGLTDPTVSKFLKLLQGKGETKQENLWTKLSKLISDFLGISNTKFNELLNFISEELNTNINYTNKINAKYDAELAALETKITSTTLLPTETPETPEIPVPEETINQQSYPEDSAKSIIWNKSVNSKDDDSKPSNNRFYRFVNKTKKSELSNYFFQVVTKTNNLKLYNEILDARKNEKDSQGRNAEQYEEQQLKETGKEYRGVYLLVVDKKGNPILKDNQYIFSTFPRIARAIKGEVLLTNEQIKTADDFRNDLLKETGPIYIPIIDKSTGFAQFEATIKGERQYFPLKDRFTVQSLELLTLEISDKPGQGKLKNGQLGQTGKLYAYDTEDHIIDLIPRKLTIQETDKVVDLIKQQLELIPKTVENTSKELNKLIYFRIPEKTSTHTLGINKDGTLQIGNTAIPFDETKLRDFLTNTKRVNVNNIDFNSEFTDIFGTKHPTYQHYLIEGENPLFQTDLLPESQVQYRNQYLIFDSSIKPFTTKETKTPVKDKKPLIKKDRKTLDRLKTLETNTRIPISDEEREWFKSNFPTIPIESVQGLIENKAFGRFLNSGRVLLSDQATTGTLYHESFHITTQLYLTPTELNRLYREVKEKTTARTDLEAEELLAEDFFNYKKTGKILNNRPARNTIFKRLLNFIKDLLNLPASSIEDIYRRLDKGYYTNRPVVGVRQFSKLDRSKISEEKGVAFEVEAISNVGALYYDHLFKGSTVNGEFIIRTPDEVDKKISVDIYNEILTTLEEKYEAEENLQIAANIEYIYNNLDELFDLFIEKNKIKGIEITTEEFEEDLDENEETKVNRTYQEANEISTRSQINDQVWELISSLKQKNSDGSDKLSEHTNLPQLVNSSSLYNFLLRQLAGLSTYEEMIEKIDKLANTRPTLTELLDRLGEPSVTARLEQQVLQDQFRQDFGKTYITSYKTVLKEDGTVYFVDANTELSAGRTLERWKNNIITKTVQTEEGKLTLNLDSIHFTNAESFLDSVGFNFSEEGLKAAKKDDNFQTSVVAIQNYIKERKGDITTLFEPTREEREAKTDVKGRLTYLAALEADNSPDTAELSFVSSTGKTIFAIGNNSTLSITVNKINKANTLAELYTDLPYLNTVSTEGSAWLNELFDATGKRRPNKKLTIALQDGVSNDADSLIDFESPTARLTSGDKWVQEINSILNGRSSLIRTSDKKSEFTVFMDKPLFSIEELKTLDNERLKEVIRGYFKSELKRIALHRTLGIGKDRDKIDEHGDKFTALQDIVSADMKKAINAELDTIKDVSPEELLTKIDELAPTFYTDLDTRTIQFFTAYANEIKHEFTSHNITKSIGISTAFKKYPLEQLINAIIINDFISSVEQTKLIFGDMVFYSDFFKRTAGFTGTRLTLANGNQINEWLNHNFKRKDKKVEDGTANIAIFEDVIVSVQQEILDSWANSLIEATKITREQADEILKPYTEITEGDAQGWITLDEWRNIMFRMGNPIPQEVFEKAQKGEILDPEEVIYFTPMKLLYAGPQKYDYLYVPAYHKFSLFPLLPSMVADKNIRKLMNTMTNQQVGYALFRSGSKVGTPVKEGKANAFYTEDGKINTENWQKQVIYYDFLGEQVKASDPVLEYTFGSQPKKLLFGGLFEEGKPINKHVDDLLEQFKSAINDIVQEEKEKLIKELGINPESYKSEDIKALLKLLRDEAKRRDLPDNLIESLQSEIINGKEVLKNKFDAQVNKIKIDSMLMSLVNSRLIRQKVLGDALVQVSSSGMEPAGKRKIETDKTLKFYRQDETGKTLPAEIMLAINLKDPSHQLLLEQYGTLEKLNSAIKKGKVDKEALQIIAYRIPTQGHNSMEFFEIVEFLPAESSTAMIVPTEIVAKAGSDFDIDKLFILKFNSRLLKLTKKQIAQNKIMNIAKEVLSMKEVFPSLITPNSSKILSDIADEIRFINKLNEDPDSDLIRSKFETKEQYKEAFNKKRKEYTASRKRAEEKNILYTGQLKLSGKNGKIAQFIRFLTAKNMIGIVALQNTHNILAQQHNLTIDGKQAEINLPHNKVSIQPEVEAISNFLGYKGGFEDKGKGTPQGDGKDKAMREIAQGAIVELSKVTPSSSLTSLKTYPSLHEKGKTKWSVTNEAVSPEIIMLARNGSLTGQPLSENTKNVINSFHKEGVEFVIGDMPNVDSQFIDYLQEIRAKFTIYHTGTTPRIKVEEVTKPTTEKADISISKLKDVENKNSISEVISQTITATVDAANDPFMFDINMNMETLPIIQYLTRSGTSFPIIGYFMSQPIINEYLKESSVHRSGFLRVTKNNKFRNQVLASVKEKYGKQSKDYTVKIFSAEELKNNLFKENQTSQEFKDQQLQILDDFLSYQTQAQFLSDAMRATNMDTWGVGKNLNLIQNKLNLIEKVKAQGFVKGIDRILEKSLIKSFNQLEFTQDIFGQFYYTQSPEFVKVKQDITNSIPVLGKKAEEQLATLIENDLINFIVQNHGYPNIVAYKDALFKSKPVAKELQRIKTNPKDEDEIKLSQNFFIRQLQPLISARKGDINNIKLYTRRYDTFLADQLTEAFREIKELNPDLAKQIMDLGILQSGLNNSPITYLGLIPYEYYNDITKQAFEKFNSQPLEKREEDLQQFEKLFLENNTIKTKAGLKLRQKKGWIFYKNYIKPLKSEIELKKRPSLIKPITEIFYSEAKKDDFIRDLLKDYPKEIIEERKIREGMWRVTVDKKDIEEYKEKYAEAVAEEVRKEEEETEKYIKEEKEIEEERKLAEGLELSLLPDDAAIGKAIFKEIIDKLNAKYSENYKLLVVPPLEALRLLREAGHAVEYTISTAPAFYIAEDKTMVFPTNFLTTEVAFHEFAHPFVDAITEQNKPLFYNLKSQLSNPENASGQLIINEVIKEYSGDLGHVKDRKLTEKGWKEAIVTALGRMAKNQLNESKDKGLIAALKQLLKRIGQYLQSLIDDPTKVIRPVEISADTTLEELAVMLNLENKIDLTSTSKQLKSIVDLKSIDSFYSKYSDEDIQRFIESKIPNSKVKSVVFRGFNKDVKESRTGSKIGIWFNSNKDIADAYTITHDNFSIQGKILYSLNYKSFKSYFNKDGKFIGDIQQAKKDFKEAIELMDEYFDKNNNSKVISLLEDYYEVGKSSENNIEPSIINIKIPKVIEGTEDVFETENKLKIALADKKENNDSFIINNFKGANGNLQGVNYVVFDPSQITILNSDKTHKEFEEFINKQSAKIDLASIQLKKRTEIKEIKEELEVPENEMTNLTNKVKTFLEKKLAILKEKKILNVKAKQNQIKRILDQIKSAEEIESISIFVEDAYQKTVLAEEQFETLIKNKDKYDRHELIQRLSTFNEFVSGYSILDEIRKTDLATMFERPVKGLKEQAEFTIHEKLRYAISAREDIQEQYFNQGLPLLAQTLLNVAAPEISKQAKEEIAFKERQIESVKKGTLSPEKKEKLIANFQKRIDALSEQTLDEKKLIKLLKIASKDEAGFDYMLRPLISSDDSTLALFAKFIKDKLEDKRLDNMKFAKTIQNEFNEYLKTAKNRDNPAKFNEGIYEEIEIYSGKDEQENTIWNKRMAFVQKYDITKYQKNKDAFFTSLGPKPELSENPTADETKKLNAWTKAVAKWFSTNTQPKPTVEINKIISDKKNEVALGITTKEEFEEWKEANMPFNDFLGETQYHRELAEPSNLYINPNWTNLYDSEGKPKNPKGKRHQFLTESYFNAQAKIPENHRRNYLLPSIEKGTIERLLTEGVISTAKTRYEEITKIKEYDIEYGTKTQAKLAGLTEEEAKFIPTHYTQPMDAKDVSLDLDSSIMLFNAMANKFEALSNVQGEIDLMKHIIGNRETILTDTKGQKIMDAFAKKMGYMEFIRQSGESFSKKHIDAFIDMIVYGELRKAEEAYMPLVGPVNIGKLTNNLVTYSAVTTLAVDLLKGTANMIQGEIQNAIEAASGEHYNIKNLATGNAYYLKSIPHFISDFGKAAPDTLPSQLVDLYDMLQGEYQDQYGRDVSGSTIKKLFRVNTLFWNMHKAEHKIQVGSGFAFLDATKVKDKKNGVTISLLDAYKKYGIDGITENTDFTEQQRRDLMNKMHFLNKRLQGVYNSFDKGTAQRYSLGVLAMVYRKYLIPAYKRRFTHLYGDQEAGTLVEGYFRTFWQTFAKDLRDFKFNIIQNWSTYSPLEKAAIKRTLTEISFILALTALIGILKGLGDDDDELKKNYMYNFVLYEATRARSETNQFLPPFNLMDTYRVVKSPSAVTTVAERAIRFTNQLLLTWDPDKLEYKRKTGIWDKGTNKSWAYFLKLVGISGYNLTPEEATEAFKVSLIK